MKNKSLQEITNIRRNGLEMIRQLKEQHANYFSIPIQAKDKEKHSEREVRG